MSTAPPPPWDGTDLDDLDCYLNTIVSAYQLGAWSRDDLVEALRQTTRRLLRQDHTVCDDLAETNRTLGQDLARRFGNFDPPADEPVPPFVWSAPDGDATGNAASIDLARHSDAGGHSAATLYLRRDGSLRVERFDHGAASDDTLGGDNHYWAEIPADYAGKLAMILSSEHLRGKLDAVDWIDRFSTRWRIPCRIVRAR